jgi:hypothetical protein
MWLLTRTMFSEIRYACRYRAVERKILSCLRFSHDSAPRPLDGSDLPRGVRALFASQSNDLRVLRQGIAR